MRMDKEKNVKNNRINIQILVPNVLIPVYNIINKSYQLIYIL